MKRNRRIGFVPAVFVFSLLMLVVGCASAGQPVLRLIVSGENSSGEFTVFLEQDFFSLSFIHSVEKTEVVEEFFVNRSGEIILRRTKYKSFGAGLPFNEAEGRFSVEGENFVYTFDRPIGRRLSLLLSPYAPHRLTINKQIYRLEDYFSYGEQIIITGAGEQIK